MARTATLPQKKLNLSPLAHSAPTHHTFQVNLDLHQPAATAPNLQEATAPNQPAATALNQLELDNQASSDNRTGDKVTDFSGMSNLKITEKVSDLI